MSSDRMRAACAATAPASPSPETVPRTTSPLLAQRDPGRRAGRRRSAKASRSVVVVGGVGPGEGGEAGQEARRGRERVRPAHRQDDLASARRHLVAGPPSGRGSRPRSRARATASSRVATPELAVDRRASGSSRCCGRRRGRPRSRAPSRRRSAGAARRARGRSGRRPPPARRGAAPPRERAPRPGSACGRRLRAGRRRRASRAPRRRRRARLVRVAAASAHLGPDDQHVGRLGARVAAPRERPRAAVGVLAGAAVVRRRGATSTWARTACAPAAWGYSAWRSCARRGRSPRGARRSARARSPRLEVGVGQVAQRDHGQRARRGGPAERDDLLEDRVRLLALVDRVEGDAERQARHRARPGSARALERQGPPADLDRRGRVARQQAHQGAPRGEVGRDRRRRRRARRARRSAAPRRRARAAAISGRPRLMPMQGAPPGRAAGRRARARRAAAPASAAWWPSSRCARSRPSSSAIRSAARSRSPRGGGVVDRLVHVAASSIPADGPPVQLRHLARRLQRQLVAQQLAEEVVVAVPLAAAVERHQEQVGALQLGQDARPSPPLPATASQSGPVRRGEDRGAQQEVAPLAAAAPPAPRRRGSRPPGGRRRRSPSMNAGGVRRARAARGPPGRARRPSPRCGRAGAPPRRPVQVGADRVAQQPAPPRRR